MSHHLSYASYSALHQWSSQTLQWNVDSSDYHSLYTSISQLTKVSGYTKSLSNEGCLRVCLSAIQRGVVFAPDVPSGLREPTFYRLILERKKDAKGVLLQALKALWKEKGEKKIVPTGVAEKRVNYAADEHYDVDEHDEPDGHHDERQTKGQRDHARKVLREYNAVSQPHKK